jgi:enoyl-CoA hydratase/carnithine racemase
MNALSTDLITALQSEIETAAASELDRVVVITGAGDAFCAGADLIEARDKAASSTAFREWLMGWRDTFRSIERVPKPVIAALNGATLAGGLELALACDIVIAADNARIGDVHARYGLMPGGGGSQRLPEAIGTRRARWLMYSASILTARQAEQWGLVQLVVAHESFRDAVHQVASTMATRSALSLASMKGMSSPGISDAALDREIQVAADLIVQADAQEGMAAFIAKRAPMFDGAHRP